MAYGGLNNTDHLIWTAESEHNVEAQNDEMFAFQSFFDGEEERFHLIRKGPSDSVNGSGDLFSLQFLVPVKLPKNEIEVNVCISPTENTASEKLVIGTYSIKFLTPIKLTVILPPEYPSESPPIFTLSSSWLNGDQLSSLCSQLDLLWNESPCMPILFTWIDWLEHSTLSYLNIEDYVDIQHSDSRSRDSRALTECHNIEDTLNTIFRHNSQEEALDFKRHDQECPICFMGMSGQQFYRLLPCKHYFCKDCLAGFCSVHVKEGTVQEIRCLQSKCKTEISPSIIKECLSVEEFDKWERLTFQKGLDLMGDITYCPKCQAAVVKEENSLNLAHCLECQFSFCMECFEPLHPGDICFFKKNSPDDNLETDSEKENKEKIRQRILKIAEMESRKLIKERAKYCPKCNVPIVKISGCNLVTCTQCLGLMCWACNTDVSKKSYVHFSDSPECSLYTMQEEGDIPVARKEKPMEIQLIELRMKEGEEVMSLVNCVNCTEANTRKDLNNHVKCWNCNLDFCFLCNKKLSPPFTRHFTKTKCKQRGD